MLAPRQRYILIVTTLSNEIIQMQLSTSFKPIIHNYRYQSTILRMARYTTHTGFIWIFLFDPDCVLSNNIAR